MNPARPVVGLSKAEWPPTRDQRVNADEYRTRAAAWRQRAAERMDARERAADLHLADAYDRLAGALSAVMTAVTPDDTTDGRTGDAISES
jgi:putative heme iron utilization protein